MATKKEPGVVVFQSGIGRGKTVTTYLKRVPLTAAQITTLHSAPVSLVSAPGAGKAVIFHWLTFQFTFGTTQFTGGGAVTPVYHGATTDLSGTTGVAAATITGAASATKLLPTVAQAGITANAGVDLLAATADFAAGDSTAVVTISYSVVKLG